MFCPMHKRMWKQRGKTQMISTAFEGVKETVPHSIVEAPSAYFASHSPPIERFPRCWGSLVFDFFSDRGLVFAMDPMVFDLLVS